MKHPCNNACMDISCLGSSRTVSSFALCGKSTHIGKFSTDFRLVAICLLAYRRVREPFPGIYLYFLSANPRL